MNAPRRGTPRERAAIALQVAHDELLDAVLELGRPAAKVVTTARSSYARPREALARVTEAGYAYAHAYAEALECGVELTPARLLPSRVRSVLERCRSALAALPQATRVLEPVAALLRELAELVEGTP